MSETKSSYERIKFAAVCFVIFVLANIAFTVGAEFLNLPRFSFLLLQSIITGLSFLFVFIVILRHYISPVPFRFWRRFAILALSLFFIYSAITIQYGAQLISLLGFEVSALPQNPVLTPDEFKVLSLYSYGVASITNGLISLAIAYLLQKQLIYYFVKAIGRISSYQTFFEADGRVRKWRLTSYTIWLILLPLPIQQALSPGTLGISTLGALFYFPAALASFVLWGLGLIALVSITPKKVLRPYGTFYIGLASFLIFQWISVLLYSYAGQGPLPANHLVKLILLLVRSAFVFAPPAIITTFLYKHVLERRAEVNIPNYLYKKAHVRISKITVAPTK